MPLFERYLGIDYSGAATPTSSLKGLRIYSATPMRQPAEISTPPGTRKYWTRRGIAEWLTAELRDGPPTLVGIDHALSFPIRYFERHRLPRDWPGFLDDFQHHWPTDRDQMTVESIRRGLHGLGSARTGNARWRRLTELRSRAKSVFHFDVQGSVAKSTHSGLPWLRHLRQQVGSYIHFWPFDGWMPPPGRSVVAEVYPALWSKGLPNENRTPDQHDAFSVAQWMRQTDAVDALGIYFRPQLSSTEREQAMLEGWILGIA